MDYDLPKLMEEARKARSFAYYPYSDFQVGSAIITEEGKIFTGCNIENVSYGATNYAERIAIFKAISEGHTSFKAIAISSSKSPKKPIYPCGICRQVLVEFNPKIIVHIDGDDKSYQLSELLPKSFDDSQM